MDPNFPIPTDSTVNCLLCYKEVPCTDLKKRRYFNHLQTDHNAFYNFNVLFKINRLDVNVINIIEGKAILAGDFKPDMNLPPQNTVFCILCRGVVPSTQFFKHFESYHNAQVNLNLMQKVNSLNGSVLDVLDQQANVGMDQVKDMFDQHANVDLDQVKDVFDQYANVGLDQIKTQPPLNAATFENAEAVLDVKPETMGDIRDTIYNGMQPSLHQVNSYSPIPAQTNRHLNQFYLPNSLHPSSKPITYKTRPDPDDLKLQIQFISSNPELATKMSYDDWLALDKTLLKKSDYKNIRQGHPLLAHAPEDLKQKLILSNPCRSVKWTQSQRNYTQLCLDDFILKKNRGPYFLPGQKGRVISWKCIVQYCPYMVINVEGRLAGEAKPHNHKANPDYFQKRESRQMLREAVKQINGPVNAIVLGVMRQAQPGMAGAVGSITALKQAARRYKHVQARKAA